GGIKAGGLVNGVLRALLRSRGERRDRPADADPRRWVANDASRGFLFADAVWPDPVQHGVEYLSLTTSTPLWIVRRWIDRFGRTAAERICRMNACRPPMVLRANSRRIKPSALARLLARGGMVAKLDAAGGAIEVVL